MEIVRFSSINKSYNSHIALRDINLSIPSNSIFGLLGPNGAGKTSLIRILTQIIKPDSGDIFFNNDHLLEKHKYCVGYLPEERGLYKKMKVGEQLIYFGRLKNLSLTDAKKRADYWLGKMDLTAWKNSILMNLSKGMQQKVQFIASLLHDPQLIILDEPFSGFDPINSETITEIILELKQAGKTILFSTHRMETVESLCDHICLINNGQNILEGSLDSIKNRYKENKFLVEGFGKIDTGNKNFVLESIERYGGNFIRAIITPHPQIEGNKILTEVMSGCQISKFLEILPQINDIFLKEVKRTK